MVESAAPEVVAGFRELLREFRGVGAALGEVVERTARLETKVDRLVTDARQTVDMQARLSDLEHWVKAELAARAARSMARGLWIAAVATVSGGAIGAVTAHFWK